MQRTPRLEKLIDISTDFAKSIGNKEVTELHVFYNMLITASQHQVVRIIESVSGVSSSKIIKTFDSLIEKKPTIDEKPKISKSLEEILELAGKIAKDVESKYTGSDHFVLAIFSDTTTSIYKKTLSIIPNLQNVFDKILENARGSSKEASIAGGNKKIEEPKDSYLKYFATDLIDLAKNGKIDPVIGRDKEIERVIHILSRRRKNNPVLCGYAGVGKTAIAEGLAIKIINNEVPKSISTRKLYALDIGKIVAGTVYRGQLEDRVKKIVEEVKQDPSIIVFIDEIHTLLGAGAAEGAMDISNMLKPALARGEFCCIGATTHDEYRKYIQRDSALERRLQPVDVPEPSREDTVKILASAAKVYEKFHGIKYTEEVLENIVDLSERFIHDRYQPDKSFDIMDEVGALVKLKDGSIKQEDIESLKKELNETRTRKANALLGDNFDEAGELLKRQELIKFKILKSKSNSKIGVTQLEDVYNVVEKWSGVPVSELDLKQKSNLVNLADKLSGIVIGQDDAIHKVVDAVKKYRTPFKNPRRPIGCYLFVGPTGVGKTLLAETLAEQVFGSSKSMLTLDMSEYVDAVAINKLIGSSAGYVGYEDSGTLCKYVQKNPYSLILFDEIEKAHPNVYQLLLQIFETGKLTDNKGRTVDFKNTIIILTSNVGVRDSKVMGFTTDGNNKRESEKLLSEIKSFFAPELLNRLDVIRFNKLETNDIQRIVRLEIEKVNKRLQNNDISIEYCIDVVNYIISKDFMEEYGARNIRKQVETLIEDALVDDFLLDKIPNNSVVKFEIKDNKLIYKTKKQKL